MWNVDRGIADRDSPGLEDTTDTGSLGDVMVGAGVVVNRVVVVVRRAHVVVVSRDGHVGRWSWVQDSEGGRQGEERRRGGRGQPVIRRKEQDGKLGDLAGERAHYPACVFMA